MTNHPTTSQLRRTLATLTRQVTREEHRQKVATHWVNPMAGRDHEMRGIPLEGFGGTIFGTRPGDDAETLDRDNAYITRQRTAARLPPRRA